MPELAEVETLTRYLKKHILNENIIYFQQNRDDLRYPLSPHLKGDIENSFIIDVKRRAKFINIKLSNNNSLIFHLGMSGRLTVKANDYETIKHDHILIDFASGNKLIFNDHRRFGMVYSCRSDNLEQEDFLKNMGIEPLIDDFNSQYLQHKLERKNTAIKTAIMDSKIVVGVGNIYASESLFQANIHPERKACSLSVEEVERLVIAIKTVLLKAIEAGGTTLKDFVSGDSQPGYFKQELKVYDRDGEACYNCQIPVQKIKQTGRSSYFCPKCQL